MKYGIFTHRREREALEDQRSALAEQRYVLMEQRVVDAERLGRESAEAISHLLRDLIRQIVDLRKEVRQIDTRTSELLAQEQRRFNTLLQQFVNLAARQSHSPTVQQSDSPTVGRSDPLANLNLFDDLPLGNEKGYKTEELELDGMYMETKPETE